MNVGIIGFGLIGQQRARAIAALEGHRVVAVYDPDSSRSNKYAGAMGYRVEESRESLVNAADIDVIIIAVPHIYTRQAAIEALASGKHVFCEKPLGRSVEDCREIVQAAEKAKTVLGAGFNYRFYPSIREAHRRLRQGLIGELTHMRCIMGHGGRPGMESEWKTSKELCGGGALLDPGVHIVDLVRYFAGPIKASQAHLARAFWEIDVEDNAFVTLESQGGCIAQCHISITEWKSTFAIELFGTEGSLHLKGRGGFYGQPRLQYHKRWAWLDQPAPEPEISFADEDISFREELRAYFGAIEGQQSLELGGAADGLAALEVISGIYQATPVAGLKATVAVG